MRGAHCFPFSISDTECVSSLHIQCHLNGGDFVALNEKQERFCLEYAKTANAAESYMIAYPNAKKNSAYSNANRLLKNDVIQARLAELTEETRSKKIANAAEIQERLTSILRGELQEEVVVVEGVEKGVTEARIVLKRPSNADAIKAGQTLAKMQGAFDNNFNVNLVVPVFGGENDLED